MNLRPVLLVVALPAEAQPITRLFKLRRSLPDRGFPLYRRDHLSLVVSGPGKLAAAAATAWLGAMLGAPGEAVWLNLGITGHSRRPLGQALLARRVIDAGSGRSWDPPIPFPPPLETETLVTLDRPGERYDPRGAVDMEASGFVTAALRFAPPQLVHCMKVVSDNEASPVTNINGARVRQWIADRSAALEVLIDLLQGLEPSRSGGGATRRS